MPLKKSNTITLVSIILILISVRGLLVLFIGRKDYTNYIYYTTLFIALFLSKFGFELSRKKDFSAPPRDLQNLLKYNFIFYAIWLLPVLIFNPAIDWLTAPLYLAILPYIVFIFYYLDIKIFYKILSFVSIIIALSVIWDFVELNILIDRYDIAFARQELLRPDNFEAVGRNDMLVRPNGITGSRPHDASNLLSMFFVFWFTKYLFEKSKNKLSIIILILLTGIALLATQVASNIIAAFFVLFFIIPYGFFKYPKNIPYIGIFLTSVLLIYLFASNPLYFDALMSGFQRAGSDGDWDGILLFQVNDIIPLILTSFIGHAGSLGLFHAGEVTEFAIIRMVFEQGIIHFLLILFILFYPLYLIYKNKIKITTNMLPLIAALLVGILSLWHYGSLFRITNEVLFWAFYGILVSMIKKQY